MIAILTDIFYVFCCALAAAMWVVVVLSSIELIHVLRGQS